MRTFIDLFVTFFRMGLFTFGGGYGMLPLIEDEVLSHSWMSAEELFNFLAVSESTPGSLSVNMSTFVGFKAAGIAGAAVATLGVILPPFITILLVARFYSAFRRNHIIRGMMVGLEPAVIGMIGAGAVSVMNNVFLSEGGIVTVQNGLKAAIFALLMLLAMKKVHPILIILISAVIGILLGNML